jgi:uncharacterized Zn finger protein
MQNIYPICPYCGEECQDILGLALSFNLHSKVELDCENCGQIFKIETHITVTYSTEK